MLTVGEVKGDIARIESEVSDLGEALIESLDSVVGLDAQTEMARKLKALIAKGYRAHRYLSHVQEEEITYLRKIINGRVAMTKEFIAAQDEWIKKLEAELAERKKDWQAVCAVLKGRNKCKKYAGLWKEADHAND